MRKLVLFTVLAVVATGCIITSGDDTGAFCGDLIRDPGEDCDDGNNASGDGCSASCRLEGGDTGLITANWSIKNLATNQIIPCPPNIDTAAVTAQPVDAGGNNVGQPIIDLYTCAAGTGQADYPVGRYKVFIALTNTNNTMTYATTLSAIVDITSNDQTFTATILNDGGYFIFDWVLRGAVSNQTLTCAQANNPDAVEITSTLVGPNSAFTDQFNCADGTGVTGGLLAGAYVCVIEAVEGQASSGRSPAMNRTIRDKNQVTDLGVITVSMDGL